MLPRDSIWDEAKAASQKQHEENSTTEWPLGIDFRPTLEKALACNKAEALWSGSKTFAQEMALGMAYVLSASSREELRFNLIQMIAHLSEFVQAIDNGNVDVAPVEEKETEDAD